jgi:saccharopine dehydrogenase (NAD+, L-lysine-forming)
VVVASSTTKYTEQAATVALEVGCDYLGYPIFNENQPAQVLGRKNPLTGCCFITDGGFHPGLPAFLVRCPNL